MQLKVWRYLLLPKLEEKNTFTFCGLDQSHEHHLMKWKLCRQKLVSHTLENLSPGSSLLLSDDIEKDSQHVSPKETLKTKECNKCNCQKFYYKYNIEIFQNSNISCSLLHMQFQLYICAFKQAKKIRVSPALILLIPQLKRLDII